MLPIRKKTDNYPKGWNDITDDAIINQIYAASDTQPQLILKHSTRCSISQLALNRLVEKTEELSSKMKLHYLDLLKYRNLSNLIEQRTGILHESPQVIIISKGKVSYSSTHHAITAEDLLQQI